MPSLISIPHFLAIPEFLTDNVRWILFGAILLVGLAIGFRDLLRFSGTRIWAISSVSFSESIRRRVLLITPVAILGIVIVSQLQHPVDAQDAVRQTIKVALFATGMVVVIATIIMACTNLPKEIENRVIFTVVTKPTTRLEIVLGKILGFAKVSAVLLLIMGVFTWGYVQFRAWNMQREIRAIVAEHKADDPSHPTPIEPAANIPKPTFMLDVGAIGGMYAGHIFLVGTEHGLGVSNHGMIGAASPGDVVLLADGTLTNHASISAGGDLYVKANGGIANTATGTVYAGGNASLANAGGAIANDGVIAAQGNVVLQATGDGATPAGAPIASGAHSALCTATSPFQERSRGACIGTGAPVRSTTNTVSTLVVPGRVSASSTFTLRGTCLPPRTPSSAVITTFDCESAMRPASESGEKPPNTTVWIAPMRAQASIATAASGIIGR